MHEELETITTKNSRFVHAIATGHVSHIPNQGAPMDDMHNALILYVNKGAARRLNQVIGSNGFTIDVIQDRGVGRVGKIIQAEPDIESVGIIEIRVTPRDTAVRRLGKLFGLNQQTGPEYLAARVRGSRGDHAFIQGDVSGRRKHRITSVLVTTPNISRR